MKKIIGLAIALIIVIGAIILLQYLLTKPDGNKDVDFNNGGEKLVTPTGHSDITKTATAPVTIRVGYLSRTLINSHLGQTLMKTNILDKNNLNGQITNFENETLLVNLLSAGALDAAFISDLPAIIAIGKGFKGLIAAYIGPLGRTGLVVPADSPFKALADLKGKQIGLAMSTSAHCNLMKWLKEQSIKPSDIKISHFNEPSVQLFNSKLADAVILPDPILEKHLRAGQVINIADSQYYGVALISKDFYAQNPEAVYRFVAALKETFFYMATHKDVVNKWVEQVSMIQSELIWACSETNTFYNNRERQINKVRLGISSSFMSTLKGIAEFAYNEKLTPVPVVIEDVIDKKIIEEAAKEIDPKTYKPEEVKALQQ
jgi:sulfonate transport system substrate-binding protein